MSKTSLNSYVQNMLSSEDENYRAGVKTELSGKTGELEKENAELRAKIGELNEQIDASHQELGAYSNHKARLDQQLAKANAIVTELTKAVEWMKSTGDYFRYKAPEQIDACKLVGAMYATAEHALSTITAAAIKEAE